MIEKTTQRIVCPADRAGGLAGAAGQAAGRSAPPVVRTPTAQRQTQPENGRLRVLILNGDLPIFPGRAGHEYLHTTGLARITDRVGLVSLVHLRDHQEKAQQLAQAGVDLYLWHSPHLDGQPAGSPPRHPRLRRYLETAEHAARTFPRRPLDTAVEDLKFRNMAPHIATALRRWHWDALVVIQTWDAHFIDHLPAFPVSVLVAHDVRALLCERRAAVAATWLERARYRLEAALYRRYERQYCQRYDLVITVSNTDEAWVRTHYAPRCVRTIPIPVDGEYFRPDAGGAEQPARIVFTGLMNHPPNVDAACFFAREVLPLVHEQVPAAEFFIVGTNPSPEVQAVGALPGVVVTGAVPDIREHLGRATVVVVPLRFASGMRNKILEAWAMSKCVVATRYGAEGLTYEDGVNILIADDARTMADRVIQVVQDRALRDAIRSRGRDVIRTRHHPEVLAEEYHRAIADALRTRRRTAGPMHAAVDLRWMRPGVAGGIENLSRAFVKHLLQLDGFNRYTVLVPAEARYELDVRHCRNVRVQTTDGPAHFWRRVVRRGRHALSWRLGLDYWYSPEVDALRTAGGLRADVVLSTSGYLHPEVYPLKNVLVVPDLQHEYHPEFFSPEQAAERRRVFGTSIRRADHVIAISEHTRQTVIERFQLDPQHVTTLHLAADPLFHPGNRHRRHARAVLTTYGLTPGSYLLFPANTWPHKNHRNALRALAVLRETCRLSPTLVCSGAPKEAQPAIAELVEKLGLRQQVQFLGYCPAETMPALYEGAAALFFPSFFEGFGIPLLEAMWCGCPVVCSNTTSLPEIGGDAALLADPHEPEHMAAALARVLTDDELRRELIAKGHERARKFSWSTFTRETIRILRDVATDGAEGG